MTEAQRQRLIIFIITLISLTFATFIMIRFAKGYRPTADGKLKGTGLLSANSFPTGAQVYIENKLTTATDNTLNLDPGEYQVEIRKDGYHSWHKKLTINAELVTQTNATLFPTSPTLEPLTFTGAINPIPSPDGSKIVYAVASASASNKNGLYVRDLNTSPINLSHSARQIGRTDRYHNYTTANYTWSPDGSQILIAFKNGSHYLLENNKFNDLAELNDVSYTLKNILKDWELELTKIEHSKLKLLPEFIGNLATSSAITNLYFSPDDKKLLYQAKQTITLPNELIPPLPSSSTQPQTRTLETNNWYVYDLIEDRNFFIGQSNLASNSAQLSKLTLNHNLKQSLPPAELNSSPSAFTQLQHNFTTLQTIQLFNAQYTPIFISSIQWLPDSLHLILTTNNNIQIIEYDATNRVTIYEGPFDPNFVYSWPNSSRLITRIQFSPSTTPNLYTIKLK